MTMGAVGYKTKKDLKAAIGQQLHYVETSMFGEEYKANGKNTVVGPCAYTSRKWFATVHLADHIITKVE